MRSEPTRRTDDGQVGASGAQRPGVTPRATRRQLRIAVAGVLAVAATTVTALTTEPATAAPTVVAAAGIRFVPAEVVMTEGSTLTFANTDVAPHDVTSDEFKANGNRLFSSATIPTGQTTPVNGVKNLDVGVYSFFCTIHPEMRGLLNVQASPLPVEEPTPPPVSVPLGVGVPTPTSITWFGDSLYAASWAQGSVMRMQHIGGGVLGAPTTYATGFESPLGIGFAPDGTLFVTDSYESTRPGRATDGRVWAIAPGGGDTDDAGVASVVVSELPNGRHNTNGLAVNGSRLYITNGNSTDDGVSGGEPEEPLSGTLVSVPLTARGLTPAVNGGLLVVEAKGMRNDYDVAFRPGTLETWMTVNGLDAQAPWGEDSLVRGIAGDGVVSDFGFPGCVHRRNAAGVIKKKQNPAVIGIDTCNASHTEPAQLFGLHVSADGLAFGPNDSYWGGDLFVAEFGSFNGPEGHKIVRVPIDAAGNSSPPVDFAVAAAPLDVAFGPPGTGLYVADFAAGQILLFAKPPA